MKSKLMQLKKQQAYKTKPTFHSVSKDRVKKFLFGSKEKNGVVKQAVIYILLICIGFVYLYPLLYMISKSFMSIDDLLDTSINWLPSKLYTKNYVQAAASMDYWKSFGQSVLIAGIPTIINVIICSTVGYGFARFEFKGKKIMMGILIFSFILPPQITMMPTYLLYKDIGILETINAYILPAALGQGLKSPIFILIFYQFFRQVPQALIEAAKIDGAGYFKSFVKISIPSAAPAILVVFLFSIVWYWNESYLTQLYVSGIFGAKRWTTLVIQLKAFADNFSAYSSASTDNSIMNLNESLKMAGTMLSILPLLIMYFILQRQFVESVDRTGITGE